MSESIRSLTVKLGYDVDTTGADIFKSRFNRLKSDMQKGISGIKTPSFKSFEKNFNKNFDAASGRMARNAKRAMAVVAVAIGAGVAAAKKVFVGFADIQQAELTLGFNTTEEKATSFLKRIKNITKDTSGVVTQLDAIRAVSLGGLKTDDTEFFVRNLSKIIKLSKVASVDFKEAAAAITTFISSGAGLDDLVRLKIISATQKEALVVSGTSTLIGQRGITSRAAQADLFLREGSPRVDRFFKAWEKTGNSAIDKFGVTLEDGMVIAGKKISPIIVDSIKGWTTAMDSFFDLFRESKKGPRQEEKSTTNEVVGFLSRMFGLLPEQAIGRKGERKVDKSIFEFNNKLNLPQFLTGKTEGPVTNNINVTVQESRTPDATVRAIVDGVFVEKTTNVRDSNIRKTIPFATDNKVQGQR